jgi:hypothetical protein
LNSFTPRTIELSMPMDFRINPDLKNKVWIAYFNLIILFLI